MPLGIRKVVAAIIVLCALTGFVMGFISVPEKSHLPGESLPGTGPAIVDAIEAKPLVTDAPPPPPEPAKKAEAKTEEAPDPLDAVAEASQLAPPAPVVEKPAAKPAAAEDRVGDLLDGITPPPADDPPH